MLSSDAIGTLPVTTRHDFLVTLAVGGGPGCPSEIALSAATAALPGPLGRDAKRLGLELVG